MRKRKRGEGRRQISPKRVRTIFLLSLSLSRSSSSTSSASFFSSSSLTAVGFFLLPFFFFSLLTSYSLVGQVPLLLGFAALPSLSPCLLFLLFLKSVLRSSVFPSRSSSRKSLSLSLSTFTSSLALSLTSFCLLTFHIFFPFLLEGFTKSFSLFRFAPSARVFKDSSKSNRGVYIHSEISSYNAHLPFARVLSSLRLFQLYAGEALFLFVLFAALRPQLPACLPLPTLRLSFLLSLSLS